MRAQMSESFQYFCFRNVFSIKALRTNKCSKEKHQANLIAHAHVELIWEPIQTQHVPCHLGLRYARCKAPCRMRPRGLCGRAPSIQDPPHISGTKSKGINCRFIMGYEVHVVRILVE